MKKLIIVFVLTLICSASLKAQDSTRTSAKYISWGLLQLLPSPILIHDGSANDNGVRFALRWQVIPLNISFRANKYISPLQFFMINPTRRFSGSMELFAQPEYSLGGLSNSNMSRFALGSGLRFIIPLKNQGETFSMSLGGKYTLRHDLSGAGKDGYFGIEGGFYALYGVMGLQFNYNFDKRSRYTVGLYFKFF